MLHRRHTRRPSLCHRPGRRCRRAPPDRLTVAVLLCFSWPLSLLTALELRPLDFLAHDRAWLRDHRLLNSLGLSTASSQAGHRLGLATLPQASSASVAAGSYPGVHGQPLRVDPPVTHATLHGSLHCKASIALPLQSTTGEQRLQEYRRKCAEGPRRDGPRLAQRRADGTGVPCGGKPRYRQQSRWASLGTFEGVCSFMAIIAIEGSWAQPARLSLQSRRQTSCLCRWPGAPYRAGPWYRLKLRQPHHVASSRTATGSNRSRRGPAAISSWRRAGLGFRGVLVKAITRHRKWPQC